MKKLLTFLFAAFVLIGLAACNGERTYAADGEYTAYEIGYHRGAPMVTEVTVMIEDDEIVDYEIDALQSNASTFEWNSETKKELGYGYRMHGQRDLDEEEYKTWLEDNDKLEWFEQAELIEAHWLENGADAVTTDDENVIDNVSSVTIKDGGYSELAQEAVQQAIDGVIKAYEVSMSHGRPQVTMVDIQLDENGDVEDITIDVLQSALTQVEGEDTPDDESDDEFTFAWNEDTKQELGYAYRMHGQRDLTEEEYKTWLEENDKLEWFEQADMIADYIVENGWEDSFAVEDVDNLSAVSITTSSYESVLGKAFNKIG
ncbi:MAG: hypothetical protein ACLFPM_05050 [Candidatus Izemoplasmatales bacterium]